MVPPADIVFGNVICISFSRKLLYVNMSLTAAQIEDNHTSATVIKNYNATMSTWVLLKKSALLTYIGLISTFITMVCCIVFGEEPIWISIDTMINVWCIALMFRVHDNIYTNSCMKCQDCCITIKCIYCYACGCCRCCAILPAEKVTEVPASPISNNQESCKTGEPIVENVQI